MPEPKTWVRFCKEFVVNLKRLKSGPLSSAGFEIDVNAAYTAENKDTTIIPLSQNLYGSLSMSKARHNPSSKIPKIRSTVYSE